ncbi:radical SAM/SPASM domain-containing protein [Pseudomonas sp. P8_241]|uniref:radical SAM/SPASM domain-containing protein n=1 Tax=Pseudomonas sp. P8_241 TaxID=3043445 RepID=UPI002A360D3C|nr:radical SAM protein [Pseudomonas sp. P8_241]WPN47862.1 radical SAM protein [Pseudomonas sp. P8_241]
MTNIITMSKNYEKWKTLEGGSQVYLNKYSGEWFVSAQLTERLFGRLRYGIATEELKELSPAEASNLAKLIDAGIVDVGSNNSDRRPSIERGQVTLVIIEALNYCNLACTYCFEDVPTKGRKMTFETADTIVSSIEKLNLAKNFVIEFNGGESFSNIKTLYHIVSNVENSKIKTNHNVSYGVTSNLTYLNEQIVCLLKKYNFSVSVSLDGEKLDHDKNRIFSTGKGSHDKIMNNIKILNENNISFSTISVISDPGQLTRSYNFLKSIKIPYVSFAIRRHSSRKPLEDIDYSFIANELFEAFQDSFLHFQKKTFSPKLLDAVILIKNLVSPHDPQYMCLRTPCGAGTNMITYDTGGDIYICQDLIKEPAFKVCNASDPEPQDLIDNNDIVKKLRSRKPGGNIGCEECDFQMFCQGGCYSTSYYASNKDVPASFTKKTPHCEFYYQSFSTMLGYVASDPSGLAEYINSTPYIYD